MILLSLDVMLLLNVVVFIISVWFKIVPEDVLLICLVVVDDDDDGNNIVFVVVMLSWANTILVKISTVVTIIKFVCFNGFSLVIAADDL